MPALALSWLLGGGWKWLLGGIATLVIGIYAASWLHHYHQLETDAAKVPGLTAQITVMQKADKDRQAADAKLTSWQDAKADIIANIRKGMRNAPIETNPVCLPTADDRRVRNEALDKLLPPPAVPVE